jgi:hypothetical protein
MAYPPEVFIWIERLSLFPIQSNRRKERSSRRVGEVSG